MARQVRTDLARSSGLRSKKATGLGGDFFLDFFLYRTNQALTALFGIKMQAVLTRHSRQALGLIALCLSLHVGLAQNSRDPLPVQVNDKYGFIDSTGKIVIPAEYDFAWGFSEGMASAWKGRQAGYIDSSGKFIIPAQFQYARGFSQGLAEVELGEEWGYINKQGNFVIPPQYADVRSFSEGLAAAKTDKGLWGYVDKNGVEKIAPQFRPAWDFGQTVAAVYRGDRCRFIDSTGADVIPFQFSECRGIKDGVAAVRVNGKWGFIADEMVLNRGGLG